MKKIVFLSTLVINALQTSQTYAADYTCTIPATSSPSAQAKSGTTQVPPGSTVTFSGFAFQSVRRSNNTPLDNALVTAMTANPVKVTYRWNTYTSTSASSSTLTDMNTSCRIEYVGAAICESPQPENAIASAGPTPANATVRVTSQSPVYFFHQRGSVNYAQTTYNVRTSDDEYYTPPAARSIDILVTSEFQVTSDTPGMTNSEFNPTASLGRYLTATCIVTPMQLTVAPIPDVEFGVVTTGIGGVSAREFTIQITSGSMTPVGTITISSPDSVTTNKVVLGGGTVGLVDKNTGQAIELGVPIDIKTRGTIVSATLDATTATPGPATANLLISLTVN